MCLTRFVFVVQISETFNIIYTYYNEFVQYPGAIETYVYLAPAVL